MGRGSVTGGFSMDIIRKESENGVRVSRGVVAAVGRIMEGNRSAGEDLQGLRKGTAFVSANL